jgi:hypothetical protein
LISFSNPTHNEMDQTLILNNTVHKNKNDNTSGKASVQILHLPLGDDSSPLGDNAAGR